MHEQSLSSRVLVAVVFQDATDSFLKIVPPQITQIQADSAFLVMQSCHCQEQLDKATVLEVWFAMKATISQWLSPYFQKSKLPRTTW